jgi:hypothetical protein
VPNVTLIPLSDDSLVEWHAGNMIGTVKLIGCPVTIGVRSMRADQRGIQVEGVCLTRSRRGRPLVEHFLKVIFDSSLATVKIESKFLSRSWLLIVEIIGVNLRVPNDIFNKRARELTYESGSHVLRTIERRNMPSRFNFLRRAFDKFLLSLGMDGSVQTLRTNWLNIDDLFGLIVRDERQIGIRRFPRRMSPWESLFVEQIEAPIRRRLFLVKPGTTLLSSKIVVHVGSARQSKSIASSSST